MTENPFATTPTPYDAGAFYDAGAGSAALDQPSGTQDGSAQPGTVDVAKDQAAAVGHSAADAGQHVAGVTQDQAKNVAVEAGNQAKDLLTQAGTELNEQASVQQRRLAASLHAVGDELHSMSQHSDQSGVATELARQGAGRTHDLATWLEDREPHEVLQELQTFARRRPGRFLLAAAGAGLLAGRLTRGIKDSATDDGTDL